MKYNEENAINYDPNLDNINPTDKPDFDTISKLPDDYSVKTCSKSQWYVGEITFIPCNTHAY